MNKEDLQTYIDALRKCAKEHEKDFTPFGHIKVSLLCTKVAELLEELRHDNM